MPWSVKNRLDANLIMKKYFSFLIWLAVILIGNAQSDNSNGETSVEMQQPVDEVKVKVFPNPATNVVNVLGLKNTPQANIIISDIYGNTVSTYHWAVRRNALNIPIATLEAGAYSLTIISEDQRVRTKFYKK